MDQIKYEKDVQRRFRYDKEIAKSLKYKSVSEVLLKDINMPVTVKIISKDDFKSVKNIKDRK